MTVCCFFFKQKTADEMRISDCSSDVCSSDLSSRATAAPHRSIGRGATTSPGTATGGSSWSDRRHRAPRSRIVAWTPSSDRKRVVAGQSESERVELGGRRYIKKKTQ